MAPEGAVKLLDFNQKLEIYLLDNVIKIKYEVPWRVPASRLAIQGLVVGRGLTEREKQRKGGWGCYF